MTIITKTQIIRAEGSQQFISVYSANLQKEWGKRLVNTQIRNNQSTNLTTAEWTVKTIIFDNDNFVLVGAILRALNRTLATEGLTLEIDAKLHVGQILFKLDKDLSPTILEEDEITYMVTYKVDQKLKKKSKAAIEHIVGYFFDTCETDATDYELYIDRFHMASLNEPIPVKEIESVITGTAHVLEQFSTISEVICKIRKSHIAWN